MHMNKIFKYLCVGLVMMKSLAWCTANEVERDAFNIQVESVTDTILEETDLSFDSVMQNDGDVINEVSVQPLNDNVDKSGISVPQNVLQPKSDKLTQSNQKDKKTKNKQERQQKKAGEKQKKLIEKTKKKDVIQQRKEERIIRDKRKTDKKEVHEQDIKRYQYQSKPSSFISLDASHTKEVMEEIKSEDINQEKSENTESSGHKLINFLIGIGVLWIIWKVMLRIWKIILRGWHRRCKKCGKWWALQIVDSELIDSWEEDELVKLNDRNAKGEITGTREAFQRVRKKQYKVHRKCKHCGQEYTSRETITIGG